jgi:hypothetical protein
MEGTTLTRNLRPLTRAKWGDSAAVMTHLESFGANFAARLMEAVKPARLVVYCKPSAQVKDALAGLSPVYMAPFGGFSR